MSVVTFPGSAQRDAAFNATVRPKLFRAPSTRSTYGSLAKNASEQRLEQEAESQNANAKSPEREPQIGEVDEFSTPIHVDEKDDENDGVDQQSQAYGTQEPRTGWRLCHGRADHSD